MIIALVVAVFAVLLFIGFPVFVCMGVSMSLPSFLIPRFVASGPYLFRAIFTSVDNTVLLAIPLFILSGEIMGRGGISKRLLEFFAFLVGKFPGGLPCAVVLTSILYGAICGAGAAAAAAVGAMAIPMLVELGYKKEFAATLVGAGGGIGIIIPPSIPFVTYAMMTGVSVGALFTAGFLPGIFIGVCLMVYIVIYCKKEGEDREKILANYQKLRSRGFWNVLKDSFWALLSPVIILGGIYAGFTTPTEAAVISVVYSLVICIFVYRTIRVKDLYKIFASAVRSYVGIGLLIAFAVGIGRVFTLLRIPDALANFMTSTFTTKAPVLACIIFVLLIIGMFMDVVPAVMIFSPLLLPVVQAFGVDAVHFGIILTVTVSIGLISPPYGLNLFVTSSIVELPVNRLFKNAFVFCLIYLVAIIIITAFPQISLFLGTLVA